MIEMLANIYDRLHFILEKTKGIEARLDLLERSKRKRKGTSVNTLYGERTKRFANLRKRIKKHED